MKILVACVGSRGDVQPYVALGAGLQQAGHEVVIAADPTFRDLIARTGLDFAEAQANPHQALEKDIKQFGSNPLRVLRFISEQFQRVAEEHFRDLFAASAGVEAIIISALAFAGLHVAEVLQIPVISTSLQPIVGTRAFPYSVSPILPEWFPFKGAYNRLSYRSTRIFLRSGSRRPLLAPRPLGTARDTFASSRSSRSKGPLVGPTVTDTICHNFTIHA